MIQETATSRPTQQPHPTSPHSRLAPLSAFPFLGVGMVLLAVPACAWAVESDLLSAAERKHVIESVCERIDAIYPFAEVKDTVRAGILARLRSGAYDGITSSPALAARVTADMEELGHDKHLELLHDPVLAGELRGRIGRGEDLATGPPPSVVESARWENYGFREVRNLEGAVGYLDLRMFFAAKHAGATAAGAMTFLAGSNAVIIDLRRNGGGWDSMVTLLAGYFIDFEEPTVVAISQSTLDQSYFASVVPPYVPGDRLTGIPLYLLLSGSTGSAAEAFASILKAFHDDVILVGETTAGAENPVERVPLDDEFVLKVPCHRKIFFGSRTGWEGRGIAPDIEVAADKALDVAHLHALRALDKRAETPVAREKLRWGIEGLRARAEPARLGRGLLQSYAGRYQGAVIRLEGDQLSLQFGEGSVYRLLPVSEGYFLVDGRDDLRIRLVTESGEVTALERVYSDGFSARDARE